MTQKKNCNNKENQRITLLSKRMLVGSPEESIEMITRETKKIESNGMILVMIRVCDLMYNDVVMYRGHTFRVRKVGKYVDLFDSNNRTYQLSAKSQEWVELIN